MGHLALGGNRFGYVSGSGPPPPPPDKMLIRFTIGTSASQSSATSIPAGSVVTRAAINITTPYSGGATLSLGQTGSLSLLEGTGDNTATIAALWDKLQDTPWGGSSLPVVLTVGGAPGAGAGDVIVEYYSTVNP